MWVPLPDRVEAGVDACGKNSVFSRGNTLRRWQEKPAAGRDKADCQGERETLSACGGRSRSMHGVGHRGSNRRQARLFDAGRVGVAVDRSTIRRPCSLSSNPGLRPFSSLLGLMRENRSLGTNSESALARAIKGPASLMTRAMRKRHRLRCSWSRPAGRSRRPGCPDDSRTRSGTAR